MAKQSSSDTGVQSGGGATVNVPQRACTLQATDDNIAASRITGTLPVANGGSGVASLTAYAPVFGGTTGIGAVQSGTVGTSGQVLTSNGAGALPTFQAASGGGTPGGSDTQVQYNNSGAFAGNSSYTYTASTNTIVLGSVAIPGVIKGVSAAAGGATGLTVSGGSSTSGIGAGGDLNLASGDSFGSVGGYINLKLGSSGGGNPKKFIDLGNAGADLATTATGGFPCIPTCNGVPTGLPNAPAGTAPIIVNRATGQFYAYLPTTAIWYASASPRKTTTDVTASRALNTTYTNSGAGTLIVIVTARCTVSLAAGTAYFQAKAGTGTPPTTAAGGIVGIQAGLVGEDNTFETTFFVPSGQNYRVDSTTSNGTVTLGSWFETPF